MQSFTSSSTARDVPASCSCSFSQGSLKGYARLPARASARRLMGRRQQARRSARRTQAVAQETPSETQPKKKGKQQEPPDDIAPIPSADETNYPMPVPREYQQTLRRSFCLGGIGLHSADFAYIRVRPAFAGEGRYFVRVPQGTNQMWAPKEDEDGFVLDDTPELSLSPEVHELVTKRFVEYLSAQDDGFDGSFEEFYWEAYGEESPTAAVRRAQEPSEEAEQPVKRGEEEEILQASVENVVEGQTLLTSLAQGDFYVHSVEHLLSALECCGVDNARIEMEGGYEVPVTDGSAQGWAINIVVAGLQPAYAYKGRGKGPMAQRALQPQQAVHVQEGDAWVALYPLEKGRTRLSAGIDATAASPIIGKQWFSWDAAADAHYRWVVAPARTFYRSLEEVFQLRSRGLIRGGTIDCAIIGYGHDWYELEPVRFYEDEPARHLVVDLTGDLALLARGGSRGIPAGHIVSHNAHHGLHLKFLRALQAAVSEADYVDVEAPAAAADSGAPAAKE